MLPIRIKAATHLVAAAALAASLVGDAHGQAPATIQGVLRADVGPAVNGPTGLKLSLYATATGGTLLQEVIESVTVDNGVFTVAPPFDPTLFNAGADRWVEIAVRLGNGSYQTLSPRQRIGSTPVALTLPGLSIQPTTVLDQVVPFTGALGPTLFLNSGQRWQSFKAGVAGEVRAVEAGFWNYTPADAMVTATLYRGVGVNSTPIATAKVTVPANSSIPLGRRFTFDITVVAAVDEDFTVQFSSPAQIPWYAVNCGYTRGISSAAADFDFPMTTFVSSRASGATYDFNGNVEANAYTGANATLTGAVNAQSVNATSGDFTGILSAETVSASELSVSRFNISEFSTTSFNTFTMAATGYGGFGLSNPDPNVRLHVAKGNVGSGWHMYFTNPIAPSQFNYTGLRVSDAGFFEVANAVGSNQFARLSGNGVWSSVSDARLKSDLSPADGLLDAALKLRPVNFRWIADGKRDMGFIAQDVKGVLPGFVVGDEKKDMLTVDYSHLSMVAIGALQEMHRELKAENEALRAELLNQTARRSEDAGEKQREIDALKARLERLESMVVSKGPAIK